MDTERLMAVIENITKEFDATERKLICCMLIDTVAADEDTPVGVIKEYTFTLQKELKKIYPLPSIQSISMWKSTQMISLCTV